MASTTTRAQQETALQLLRPGDWVTKDALLAAGLYQPPVRILELRRMGYDIETQRYSGVGADGNWHKGMGKYRLVSVPEHAKREEGKA